MNNPGTDSRRNESSVAVMDRSTESDPSSREVALKPCSPWHPEKSPGYSVTELVVASTVFLILLTATTAILVEWNRRGRQADFELDSLNSASRALQQLNSDLRVAQYVYHRAWIQVVDLRPGGAGRTSGQSDLGTSGTAATDIKKRADTDAGTLADDHPLNGTYIPLVPEGFPDLENPTNAVRVNEVGEQFYPVDDDTNASKPVGAVRVLALATDQPFGILNLRYIIYYLGGQKERLVPDSRSTGTNNPDLVVRPLFRVEGCVENRPNLAWYTMSDRIDTPATSGFKLTINTSGSTQFNLPDNVGANGVNWSPTAMSGFSTAADRMWRQVRLCDVVVGSDDNASLNPFTLRNPHPYANAGIISPYLATVSLHVKRNDRRTIRWIGGKPQDLIEVTSTAFVGNIPLPQPASGS